MNFLAPLFLLGALAISLPIIFHLIRRTTREKISFSSLMFLVPTPPRVTRRSRLENIWLLILRCLVLLLIAAAFGRPFLQKPLAALPDSNAGKRVVLLLDASASMRRENLWPTAKEKTEAILSKASPLDEVAVFTFDVVSRPVLSFEEWTRLTLGERLAAATDRLNGLTPGWAGTELGNALINAVESLDEAEKRDEKSTKPRERQIVLVSDLQEGSHLQTLQAFEWPRGLTVIVEQIKPRRPTNAGLQTILENDDSAKEGADAAPRIRISNAADSAREQFQLRWHGPELTTVKPLDVYVPPGQSRIAQVPQNSNATFIASSLVLSGDDQEFDNSLFMVQPKAQEVVLAYFGLEPPEDSGQPLFYLRRALQKTHRQAIDVIQHRPGSPFSGSTLERAHLAIVADVPNDTELASLQQFLSKGKTVLVLMKTPAAATVLGRLAGIDVPPATEATGRYAMFAEVDFEHPLFAPFADPRFSDFTKVHFWKHRRLDLAHVPNARALARFDDGEIALGEITVGQGRIFVLTSGWQPAESQFALSSKFVPFLYSVLEQSGVAQARPPQYIVGENIALALSATNDPGMVTLQKPDGTSLQVQPKERFSQTDLPGIYTLTSQHATQQFAVNLDPLESRTAPLSADDLEKLGVSVKQAVEASPEQVLQKRVQLHNAELENRQKLWRWFLIAALVVLMAETILAGILGRRASTQPVSESPA